jgi:hypothetical protein
MESPILLHTLPRPILLDMEEEDSISSINSSMESTLTPTPPPSYRESQQRQHRCNHQRRQTEPEAASSAAAEISCLTVCFRYKNALTNIYILLIIATLLLLLALQMFWSGRQILALQLRLNQCQNPSQDFSMPAQPLDTPILGMLEELMTIISELLTETTNLDNKTIFEKGEIEKKKSLF